MAIVVNGKQFVTLSDEFFVNGAKVYAAFANGVQVYPDGSIPYKIVVEVLPDKLAYEPYERIDYTGMVVVVYDQAGNPCTDIYPDGIIPHEDLILFNGQAGDILYKKEVTKDGIIIDQSYEGQLIDAVETPVNAYDRVYVRWHYGDKPNKNWREIDAIVNSDAVILISPYDMNLEGGGFYLNYRVYSRSSSGVAGIMSLNGVDALEHVISETTIYKPESISGQFTYDGDTAYSCGSYGISVNNAEVDSCFPNSSEEGAYKRDSSYGWVALFGSAAHGDEVQVSWKRPQDGAILSDSFSIEAAENESGENNQ